MGALLTDYICLSRKETGTMPKKPAIIRSIVTSALGDSIAASYGVKTVECLTGFKWIASVMADFERSKEWDYVFGYEESYGYNIETEVRDKDGISAAALCAEMTLYWRSKGKSLLDRLADIWIEHGYFHETAISKGFPGASGGQTMKNLMARLRTEGLKEIGGKKVLTIRDVLDGTVYDPLEPAKKDTINLPSSNVLQFFLEGGTVVSARPSGTEPKIKFYISCPVPVNGGKLLSAKDAASQLAGLIADEIRAILEKA
jgi:phosphoglucomutase